VASILLSARSFVGGICSAFLLSLPAFAQSVDPKVMPSPTFTNVSYGPHQRNVIDFWQAKMDRPTPLVVAIHGGGFIQGDKSEAAKAAVINQFLSWGISFASIDYRYSTDAPYPVPMLDAARAIQFLRTKAAAWNIDRERIGAYGSSAGGGISLWLAFHDDLAKPESNNPIERQSTRLRCAGAIGGQSTYDPLKIRKFIGLRPSQHPALLTLYGLNNEADLNRPQLQKMFDDASPIMHLTKDDPPVILYYQQPDKPLPTQALPGDGIHHPKFGQILKKQMDRLHIECVYRNDDDGKSPAGSQCVYEFMRDHLSAHYANLR
jgi:acetyl esterase